MLATRPDPSARGGDDAERGAAPDDGHRGQAIASTANSTVNRDYAKVRHDSLSRIAGFAVPESRPHVHASRDVVAGKPARTPQFTHEIPLRPRVRSGKVDDDLTVIDHTGPGAGPGVATLCDLQRNLCLRCHHGPERRRRRRTFTDNPAVLQSLPSYHLLRSQQRRVLGRVTLLLLCEPLVEGGWCDAGALAGQEYVAGHLRTER